jgi:EpsI family protein
MATLLAFPLLIIAGIVVWSYAMRPTLESHAKSLEGISYELDGYRGVDTPVGEAVEEMLRADFNVQREYFDAFGNVMWVYVGYYSTVRGGTPEHTPRACYVAHSWSVIDSRTIHAPADDDLSVVEYLVESGGQQQLVHFWYRSFRSTGMLSTLGLQLDHVFGKLVTGRGDGALVRLSTPLIGVERETARAAMIRFAATLDRDLARVWPSEAARAE